MSGQDTKGMAYGAIILILGLIAVFVWQNYFIQQWIALAIGIVLIIVGILVIVKSI